MLSSLSTSQCLTRPNTRLHHYQHHQNHDHDHHNEVDLYQIDKLQDFDISGFSKLTKEQVLQGTAPEDKSPLHCCHPQQDYAYVILTILKSVLNFVCNFVIFLFFFRINIFCCFFRINDCGSNNRHKKNTLKTIRGRTFM